jgi:CelD/BcsL family acetyltransferase involved in cellulose biosynthesis
MYVVELSDSIAPVRAEWDALADRVGASPFLRPGWLEAWKEAFGADVGVLTARDEGTLAGVLPIVARGRAIVSPTNWHTPVFGALAESEAVHAALADALLARRAARVDLAFVDAADAGLGALRREAARSGYAVVERTAMRSPYVALDGDFESYRAGLGRKLRKELGRLGRRLAAEGRVEYQFHDGAERFDELLDEAFEIEGSGWKTEAGTAIVSRPETRRFYRDVARWSAGRGTLVLAFVRLDGRAPACDICIEDGGAFNVLKGGFDPAYRRFGPGALLTAASIERAYSRGLASYELLGGEDHYKLAWTSTVRERIRFQAFSPSPAGRLSRIAWTRGRAAAKRVLARLPSAGG